MAAELEYSIMVPLHHHPFQISKFKFQYVPTCYEKILQSVREKIENKIKKLKRKKEHDVFRSQKISASQSHIGLHRSAPQHHWRALQLLVVSVTSVAGKVSVNVEGLG